MALLLWVRVKSAGSHNRSRLFDALGVGACLWFAVQVTVDAGALGAPVKELDLLVDEAALAAGFRPGVEWFSIYKSGEKIGFIRNQRARDTEQIQLRSITRVWSPALGPGPTQIELETRLDLRFQLQAFEAKVSSPVVTLTAIGTRVGEQLEVRVDALGERLDLDFPVAALPRFNQTLRPVLMQRDLEPQQRYSFEVFDPMTMQPKQTVIEYVGKESVVVLGEAHQAHRLRQELAGEVMDSWVNDLGEVLREELPGGLLAVRESEAEAVWGLPNAEGVLPGAAKGKVDP